MASKKAEKKGNSVELGTFRSWGKEKIFGVKTVEDTKSGRTMVNFVVKLVQSEQFGVKFVQNMRKRS